MDDENNVTIDNREAIHREVERLCEIVNVNVLSDELPNGCEFHWGDDGVRLSGDQCQRVALLRALLDDTDFLVLYEAKSELDSNLQREVQDAIEFMDNDYWILAITYRLSTVKNADQIDIIDRGKMIESGAHRKSLENDREYADLYAIQACG